MRPDLQLRLSPQMLQRIEVLQLTTLDLAQLIEQELQENETLEQEAEDPAEAPVAEAEAPAEDGDEYDGEDEWEDRTPGEGPSRMEVMGKLWSDAGIEGVETRKITVQRTFADFDDFWASSTGAGSVRATIETLSRDEVETVKTRVRAKLSPDAEGRITHSAFANAIKGRVRK